LISIIWCFVQCNR